MVMVTTDPSSAPTFASRTPLHIGAVGLTVRDLDRTATFYRDALGLDLLQRDGGRALLGAGGVSFLELEHAPAAKPDDKRSAGLFHTAFLMPTRKDLGNWMQHAARSRVPLTGASDHLVSEAIYLDDPEGNGVEVYSDRPADSWRWNDGGLAMSTDPLDIEDLLRAADADAGYQRAPGGLRIGHVHLRVGDAAEAERFYRDAVGLDLTTRYPGASFLSSGRYHHHLAANNWQSRGAGRRDPERAGLSYVTFAAKDDGALAAVKDRLRSADPSAVPGNGSLEIEDPWGTRLRFTRA
jgi:catechol 2,3-dioxygenase